MESFLIAQKPCKDFNQSELTETSSRNLAQGMLQDVSVDAILVNVVIDLATICDPKHYRLILNDSLSEDDMNGSHVTIFRKTSCLLEEILLLGSKETFIRYSKLRDLFSVCKAGRDRINLINDCKSDCLAAMNIRLHPSESESDNQILSRDMVFGPDVGAILEGMHQNLAKSIHFTSEEYDLLLQIDSEELTNQNDSSRNDAFGCQNKQFKENVDRTAIIVMTCLGFICCCSKRIQAVSDSHLLEKFKKLFLQLLLSSTISLRSATMDCFVGLIASCGVVVVSEMPSLAHLSNCIDLFEVQTLIQELKSIHLQSGKFYSSFTIF